MKRKLLIWLIIGSTLLPHAIKAEGTKEMSPVATDVSTLVPNRADINFAGYDEGDDLRIYIEVKDFTTETIYLGFQENQSNSVYYRLKDPTGTVVHGPTAIPGSGAGYIANHAQAVAGPLPLSAGGYTPDIYNPTMNGAYYIEYNYNDPNIKNTTSCYIDLWDITVGSSITAAAVPGRVHSQSWSMSSGSFTTPFNGMIYVYTTDSIVSRLDLNGFQPFEFFINCNSFGVANTNNFPVDRMSIASIAYVPEYKLFLNDPDSTIFPTGNLTTTLGSTPTIVGCDTSYCIQVNYSKAATAQVVIDLNGTNGYQAGTEDVLIVQQVDKGPNCFYWNGKDNFGATVTPNQNIRLESTVVTGLTNFPIWDAECNPYGFIVDIIRPPKPRPNLRYDDTNLGGGANTTVGCVAPCHAWGSAGAGCSGSSVGDKKLINTYWFTSTDFVAYLAFLPYCPPIAFDDTTFTDQGTDVIIDVLANDKDANDDIVNSSTSIIGAGPSNGSITSINATTGAITYSPNIAYIGVDSFDYVVCDGQSLCDTATAYITVSCPNTTPNTISGYVFYDYFPSNGTMDGGDIGISSVDVNIFRDLNANGLIDGGDPLVSTATSNGSGKFSYTPNDNLKSISRKINMGSDDAEEDIGDGGSMDLTSIDLDLSEDGGSSTIIGLRFQNINIPQGAIIDSAFIIFTARSDESGSTTLNIQAENVDSAVTYSNTNSDVSSRSYTSSVSWTNTPGWNDDDVYTSPDLTSIVQQVINRPGWQSGNPLAFGVTGTDQEREAHSYENDDSDTNKIPQLIIKYAQYPASYIMEIDTTTAPAQYTLTTPNLNYVTFTSGSQSDCIENFGLFNEVGFWPLALDDVSFSATRQDNIVETSWDVNIPDNKIGYIIERSENDRDFSQIGRIELDSSNFHLLEYEFPDLFPKNDIDLFYRLKIKNDNGTETITESKKVSAMPASYNFARVYPSLIDGGQDLNIEFAGDEHFATVQIFSITGKNILSKHYDRIDNRLITVDLNNANSGLYLVKVSGDNNKDLSQTILVK
ncbi:MAG: T9SS type A sorting domain-containing protein [Chitinophagales bacterium]|nr:T9SS type A sorting domain-containing protein [Chitinophagales bacterium]